MTSKQEKINTVTSYMKNRPDEVPFVEVFEHTHIPYPTLRNIIIKIGYRIEKRRVKRYMNIDCVVRK